MQATERMLKFAKTYNLKLVDTGTEKIAAGKVGQIADMDVTRTARSVSESYPRTERPKSTRLSGFVSDWRKPVDSD